LKVENVAERIKITRRISIASPYPAILLEKEGLLVAADLHIGLEDESEEKGIHIPAPILPTVIKHVITPAKDLGCRGVILLGDVKHEFAEVTEPEWFGVKKLISKLREHSLDVEVVRGNHDNYIIKVLKELGVPLHDPYLELSGILLTHGHKPLTVDGRGCRVVILGHEHPAITLKDDVGAKHRFKAFIDLQTSGCRYLVLPSVSPLAYGSDFNEVPADKMLSPILRTLDLSEAVPYVIEAGVAVKRFPKIGYL
jgi:putative SbcD/Mre11-related phosphoesterase